MDNNIAGVTSGCIFMFGDDGTKVAVKEKPFRTVSREPKSLIRAGSDQVLGSLSEHVGVGFNFAGRGIDNRATGLVLTPACVEILQLRAKLVLLETPCLPLLSRNSFDTWVGGAKSAKQYASFTK